jgi:predicted metalloprotease
MRWRNLERSKNVEDRRGRGAKVAGGVGGLGIIGVLLALFLGGGGDGLGGMGDLLGQLGGAQQAAPPAQESTEFEGIDDDEAFVMAILGTTETLWTEVFVSSGQTYDPARVVLFSNATESGCGGANSATGPHYCPLDETVYIDLTFYDELQRRFGAEGGDFAEAYVLAHEIGHHIQQELGIMDDVRRLQQERPGDANEYSVRLELQADCLAGVWANSIFQRENVLEPGDIREGLSAAESVGDDRIQQTTTGRVNPESFTHGTSEQRVNWFNEGYRTGDAAACDTFNTDI